MKAKISKNVKLPHFAVLHVAKMLPIYFTVVRKRKKSTEAYYIYEK